MKINQIIGYSDGTYFFIVVAHNKFGDTLSNCLEIVVREPRAGIPGYNILIITGFISSVMLAITLKKYKTTK